MWSLRRIPAGRPAGTPAIAADPASSNQQLTILSRQSEQHWGKPGDPGRSGADNRLFVEAVLWIARTGAPWRDLPASFGNWNSVFQRFRRWTLKGVFERMFKALRGDPDFEYVIADGTISRVHQKASGAKGSLSAKPLGARAAA
jgi:transposase